MSPEIDLTPGRTLRFQDRFGLPDWKPNRWTFDDPQRATFWGMRAPDSWFDEASAMESVVDGASVETRLPVLRDRPAVAT